jgi:hypothetical protein
VFFGLETDAHALAGVHYFYAGRLPKTRDVFVTLIGYNGARISQLKSVVYYLNWGEPPRLTKQGEKKNGG